MICNVSVKTKLFISLGFIIAIGCKAQDSTVIQQRDVRDLYNHLFRKDKPMHEKTTDKPVSFSLIPAFREGGGGKNGLVVSFNTSFYLGDPQSTNLSNITFTPYFSLSNQYVFPVRLFMYTKDNKYNLIGDYRYMIYPQDTYGLGSHTARDPQSVIDYQQWRFYQFVTRRVWNDFLLGIGVQIDYYKNLEETSFISEPTDFDRYTQGNLANERSSGLSTQLLYDSRTNSINPDQGLYVESSLRFNTKLLGGTRTWSSLYVDARKYFSFRQTSHRVLATRAYYWTIIDGDPHYLDLPSIGWDRYGKTGRGFTQNRFRSNAMLYFEGEYRTDLTRDGLLGATFFANLSSVSDLNTQKFTQWHPAIGTGLRLKWSKIDQNNITLDLGISKKDWTLRLGISENF